MIPKTVKQLRITRAITFLVLVYFSEYIILKVKNSFDLVSAWFHIIIKFTVILIVTTSLHLVINLFLKGIN